MSYWANKVAIVTGGTAGLGREIVGEFLRHDARVVVAARNSQRLRRMIDELKLAGQDVLGIETDVTQPAAVEQLVAETMRHFGRLDVLVNNVGQSDRGRVIETSAERFLELFETNFLSVVHCTQAAMPHLLATKGHVINIGSLAAKSAARFLGAYPASKFPLAAYSQQLRLELGPEGLHVLLVCPGPLTRDDAGHRYAAASGDLPASAQQPGGGVKLKTIPPADLAAWILRACERRQPELVVPAKARLLFAISQLFPTLGDWLVRKNSRG